MSRKTLASNVDVAKVLSQFRMALGAIILSSAIVNVLLISGSIYMMLVYDSVLPSHSLPTLLGLFALVIVAYVLQAFFSQLRASILADLGSALDRRLALQVQRAMIHNTLGGVRGGGDGLIAMRDLDNVRSFLSGTGPSTLIDFPFAIIFLVVLGFLHIWLAAVAVLGAMVLLGLTIWTDRTTREPMQQLGQIQAHRSGLAESNLRHVEVLSAMGMRDRLIDRWGKINDLYLSANFQVSRSIGVLGGASRTFRLFLQSAMLAVGAVLVIDGKASGGVIFASSMLSARALAPLDQAIGNWRSFTSARLGWRRLNGLLAMVTGEAPVGVELPLPSQTLEATTLYVAPPGANRLTINGVDIRLKAGDALGVIGPSAAGKTSLGRALIGVWPPTRGTVRLDGAALDQWGSERLGSAIGYLPQTVELLQGTVGENISRFEPQAPSEKIIRAARAAGIHDLIVKLPDGYDTAVGPDGQELSAGQRQRVGLARALYGDPFLVLLDEPNANLDAEGEAALERAIEHLRARGAITVVIAHRPSVLAKVSHILLLREGRVEALGQRDEVLRRLSGAKPQPTGKIPGSVNVTAGVK